ncbi:MAG: mucoidy inhibitor MuiA family protein [Deltaproteobacteria bacterium]|nr:mucoidy inhibitor MuiA family protein [Deltaproteobacteria bacterium]
MTELSHDKGQDEGRVVVTPVHAVLVMEDRAQVTRGAEIELEPGIHRLRIEDVTPLLADRSLRCRLVKINGDLDEAAARVLDFRVQRQYLVRGTRPEREQEITAAIEALAEEYQVVRDDALAASRELSLLGRSMEGLSDKAGLGMVVGGLDEGWLAQVKDVMQRRAVSQDEHLATAFSQEERKIRLSRLARERDLAVRPVSEYKAAVELECRIEQAGPFRLEVEYQVPCALWRPSYMAELAGGDKPELRWTSLGTVWQASGEDWSQVELTFSTERPTLGAELPLLEDDYLSSREKSEHEKTVVDVSSRDQVIAKTGDEPSAEQHDTPPGLDDGGETRYYKVAERVDLPGDGRPHQVEFDRWTAEAESQYRCLPEKAPWVFLRSMQKNASDLPLLAGPVSLMRHGGFVGRSSISYVASGERYGLSWGSEDGLVVLRDVVRKREDKGLRKRQHHEFKIKIYLANYASEAMSLDLLERIPVSELEQIEVTLLTKESSEGFSKDDQGLLTWPIELAPGQEKRIRLAFEVVMPTNVNWQG